jgi:hypothetical protein
MVSKYIPLAVALGLLTSEVFAQSSDVAYCAALAKTYREVNTGTTSAAAAEVINQCNRGNTAAGIPSWKGR